MPTTLQNLIDGERHAGASGLSMLHISPADHSRVELPRSDLMDVVRVVQAANRAQALWSKSTREERELAVKALLRRFEEKLAAEADVIARTLHIDIGMPLATAQTHSLPLAQDLIRKISGLFDSQTQADVPRAMPTGHSAVLLGWTDPLSCFCRRIPILLAAGNSVVVKPSSKAPRTIDLAGSLLQDAMKETGVPPGLFAVLHGAGAGDDGLGHALLTHPAFKTIYWIGRSEAALQAQAIALQHEKRFHFVGSGRNPAILFQGFEPAALDLILEDIADAIVDPHARGPYRPSRLFVQESIYKSVIETLARKLDERLDRTGALPETEIARFEVQTRLALSETGKLVTGGERREAGGNVAQPTLIRDLTNCSTLQGEELAGPLATIASFKYSHEALKYANVSPLGLAAYVLHPDPEKARGVAEKLETARVFFSSRPSWSQVFFTDAPALKQSANGFDGLNAIFEHARPRATWFS